ncbi:hypothetical protein BT93_G2048 [Corymbia citriodora subsp. variegata]|nr:hypothetical protein BT93_G2048 [Corymbia citriodora subsp. variegata]
MYELSCLVLATYFCHLEERLLIVLKMHALILPHEEKENCSNTRIELLNFFFFGHILAVFHSQAKSSFYLINFAEYLRKFLTAANKSQIVMTGMAVTYGINASLHRSVW